MYDKGAAVMSEEYMEKNPIQVADRLFGAVELLSAYGDSILPGTLMIQRFR